MDDMDQVPLLSVAVNADVETPVTASENVTENVAVSV
jgi:hypothetical protein